MHANTLPFLKLLTFSKGKTLGRLCRNNETKFHLLDKSALTFTQALPGFQNDRVLNMVPL